MAIKLKTFFTTVVIAADRFLKKDRPTETNFRNLFDSLCFRAEILDSAKTVGQGLIKVPSAAEILARDGVDVPGFTLGITPELSPEVIDGIDTTVAIIQDADGHLKYQVNVTPSSNTILWGTWVDLTLVPPSVFPGTSLSQIAKYRTLNDSGGINAIVEIRGQVKFQTQQGYASTNIATGLPAPAHDMYWSSYAFEGTGTNLFSSHTITPIMLRLATSGILSVHSVPNFVNGSQYYFLLDKIYTIGA
jgi:hypothetical protein